VAIKFWTPLDTKTSAWFLFPKNLLGHSKSTNKQVKKWICSSKCVSIPSGHCRRWLRKHSSVSQNRQKVTDRIVEANCAEHVLDDAAKKAAGSWCQRFGSRIVQSFQISGQESCSLKVGICNSGEWWGAQGNITSRDHSVTDAPFCHR
jgi:hypothetical protein